MKRYDYSDALIRKYLPEGWIKSSYRPDISVYFTTSPTEFKNFIANLARQNIKQGGKIAIWPSAEGPEVFYAYGNIAEVTHYLIVSEVMAYYYWGEGSLGSMQRLMPDYQQIKDKIEKNIYAAECSIIGFPTIEEAEQTSGDLIYWLDKYESNYKEFLAMLDPFKTSPTTAKDFAPGQDRITIKNKLMQLKYPSYPNNFVVGEGFELLWDTRKSTNLKATKTYQALKSLIKE